MVFPKWSIGGVLSWDIFGYYSYLPGLFYGDLGKLDAIQGLITKYDPCPGIFPGYQLANGNFILKYSSGLAILYAPFFGIAHIWAKTGGYLVDGMSHPYQASIAWGCMLYALAGLWVVRKFLLRYFEDKIVAITIICVAIGTHYLNYASFDSPMSHGPLFLFFALILLFTDNWYKNPTLKNSFILGLTCGFAVMTRPTEIFCLLLLFFWKIESINKASIKARYQFLFKDNWAVMKWFIIAFIIGGLPQMLYWQIYAGRPLEYSYQGEFFNFNGKYLLKCFFSYRKGWLVYTPMMIFALVGLYQIYKKERLLFNSIILFFIFNTYVIFSWKCWWYGGGFGQRAMIDSYPVLMIPMAVFWREMWQDWKKWLALAFACFFVWLNLFQHWQAHGGGFETDNMTSAFYWRIFGNTKVDDKIDRKLLDTEEEMPLSLAPKLQQIYFNDLEKDTTFSQAKAHSGKYAKELKSGDSLLLNVPLPPKKEGWLRLEAYWNAAEREPDVWQSPRMYLMLYKDTKCVKEWSLRPHRYNVLDCNGQWNPVFLDLSIPKKKDFDRVVVKFKGEGSKISFIDDIKVSYTEEN